MPKLLSVLGWAGLLGWLFIALSYNSVQTAWFVPLFLWCSFTVAMLTEDER